MSEGGQVGECDWMVSLGLRCASLDTGDNAGVGCVDVWDEVVCEEGGVCRGGGRVGPAEEIRVEPGVGPLGGREVFFVREPAFVPAVDAVFFALGGGTARGGGLGGGVEYAADKGLGVVLKGQVGTCVGVSSADEVVVCGC